MEKVIVKHTGKKKYSFRHGHVGLDFKPGEEKEVSAAVADVLLRETATVREWDKKNGSLAGQTNVSIFEKVENEKAAAPAAQKQPKAGADGGEVVNKGENK